MTIRLPIILKALAPAFLVLGACATTPVAWQNQATGEQPTEAEFADCRLAAQQQAEREALTWSGPGFGYGVGPRRLAGSGLGWGWGAGPGGLGWQQRMQELNAFCLRVKGYRLVPQDPGPRAG